jgi:hypothetical protein
MEQKRREFTIADVQMSTHYNRQHFAKWIAKAERAFADLDRDARMKRHECRWCFYAMSNGIAGAAMTDKPCDSCGEMQHYSSTATDRLCHSCGVKLGLCVSCVADIDLVDRRKLERRK